MVLEIHYSLKYVKSNQTLSKPASGIALKIISHYSSTVKRSGVIIWKGEQSIAAPVPPFPLLLSGLDSSSHTKSFCCLNRGGNLYGTTSNIKFKRRAVRVKR